MSSYLHGCAQRAAALPETVVSFLLAPMVPHVAYSSSPPPGTLPRALRRQTHPRRLAPLPPPPPQEKNIKHTGNITLGDVIEVARIMRPRSCAKYLAGTVKEILGTAVSVGCSVDRMSPTEVMEKVRGQGRKFFLLHRHCGCRFAFCCTRGLGSVVELHRQRAAAPRSRRWLRRNMEGAAEAVGKAASMSIYFVVVYGVEPPGIPHSSTVFWSFWLGGCSSVHAIVAVSMQVCDVASALPRSVCWACTGCIPPRCIAAVSCFMADCVHGQSANQAAAQQSSSAFVHTQTLACRLGPAPQANGRHVQRPRHCSGVWQWR